MIKRKRKHVLPMSSTSVNLTNYCVYNTSQRYQIKITHSEQVQTYSILEVSDGPTLFHYMSVFSAVPSRWHKGHDNNIPTMQSFTGISRHIQPKSWMLPFSAMNLIEKGKCIDWQTHYLRVPGNSAIMPYWISTHLDHHQYGIICGHHWILPLIVQFSGGHYIGHLHQ